jgi:hypothetical protein
MTNAPCPHCGERCAAGDSYCTQCGARLPVEDDGNGLRLRAYLVAAAYWFLDLAPGLVRPVVLIMSAIAILIAAAIGGLALYMGVLGAVISACLIGGFGMLIYWTALSWVLYGDVVMPSEALSEFRAKHWWALVMLTLTPLAIGLALAERRLSG